MRSVVRLGLALFLSTTLIVQGAELGLKGAWLFDDTSDVVRDGIGGANGKIKGSAKWSNNGKSGGALELPGKGDSYAWVPYAKWMDSDPYTFVAWTKLDAASWQYIVWQDGEVWPEARKGRHLDIWVHEADYPVTMWHTDAGVEGRIDAKAVIADGKWHHIGLTSDGKKMRLYVDGALDGEADIGGKLVANGQDAFWFGARPGDVAATGLMDDIGFFAQALSENELKRVMSDGLAPILAVESRGKLGVFWAQLRKGL